MAALGWGLTVFGGLLLLVFVAFLIAPDRVKDFFGSVAMLARSLAASRAESQGKRKHRRRTDPPKVEHVHARQRNTPRPSLLMTIRGWASPPRDSGERRRDDDTPE